MQNNKITPDKIVFSKRKTLALQINEDGLLIVRAPINTPNKRIEKLLKKYEFWIIEKQKQINKHKYIPKKYANGEQFMFLGKLYPLEITDENTIRLSLEDNKFFLTESAIPNGKMIFKNWYKTNMQKIADKQVKSYSNIMNLQYTKISVTFAEKRWGSCSYKNNLNFSYRLAMAPINVINYVVVHELAHISQKNHSYRFWEIVKNIMPNYKIYQNWLKENSRQMRL